MAPGQDSGPERGGHPHRQLVRQAAGGDGLHVQGGILPQAHDGPLAKLFLNLGQGCFQGLGLFLGAAACPGACRRPLAFRHIHNLL